MDVRSGDSITLERQLSSIIPPRTLYKACHTTLPIRADPVYATVPAAADVRPRFLGSLKLEERDHQVLEGLWSDVGNKPLFSGVRREKAALSSGCKSHPANAPARFNLVINRKTADALA